MIKQRSKCVMKIVYLCVFASNVVLALERGRYLFARSSIFEPGCFSFPMKSTQPCISTVCLLFAMKSVCLPSSALAGLSFRSRDRARSSRFTAQAEPVLGNAASTASEIVFVQKLLTLPQVSRGNHVSVRATAAPRNLKPRKGHYQLFLRPSLRSHAMLPEPIIHPPPLLRPSLALRRSSRAR